MMSPEEAYKYDSTFQRVVDLMRAHLSVYEITPAELRQAAMLAATMHESQRVRPLFMRPFSGDHFKAIYMDEAKNIPPAMFGRPYGVSDRYPTAFGVVEQVEKKPTQPEHCHVFYYSGKSQNYNICDCGISDVYYNWAYNKKP